MAGGDNFGLTSVESGLAAAQQSLTVVANNLANQSTPGFEASWPELVSSPVAVSPAGLSTSTTLSSVSGVTLTTTALDETPGPLAETGIPSDLALTGPGYFPVRTAAGIQLTRNGQFTEDAAGHLVSAGGGVLLSLSLKPIVLPPGAFTVQNGQVVSQAGTVVAQLGIAQVTNPEGLLDTGDSLLQPSAASGRLTMTPALGQDIVQGALEGANVSLVGSMASLVTLSGQYDQMATAGKVAQDLEQITNSLAVLS